MRARRDKQPDLPHRLPPADILLLERLGIRTLAQFTAIPARKIAARFGPAGRRAWELATGQDATPVTAPVRELDVVHHLVMPAPTASREMLLVGLKQLVAQAFAKPELRDRGVRRIGLQAIFEGDRRSAIVGAFAGAQGTLRSGAGHQGA